MGIRQSFTKFVLCLKIGGAGLAINFMGSTPATHITCANILDTSKIAILV
jgi:hypothetical protein